MIEKIEKHHYYTDAERYEWCRKFKLSGLTIGDFTSKHGLNRRTFADWYQAYKNINGKFINVNLNSSKVNTIIDNDMVKANILTETEKAKKSSHFNRFDHSIVVIEVKGIKITTSLEQAEAILEKVLG